MDVDFFVQQLVNGLTLGSVYALIALGYSMVYGILKLLNFAHGEVYMFGAFIGYFVLSALGGSASPSIPVAPLLVIMFLAAMLGAGLLGVVIERYAYRPLRNAPRIAPLISAIGVSFFLQASALLLFTAQFRTYDTPQLIPIDTTGSNRCRPAAHLPHAHHRDRLDDRAHDRPDAARQQDSSRQGDAGGLLRPRGRGDDGHRPRPA